MVIIFFAKNYHNPREWTMWSMWSVDNVDNVVAKVRTCGKICVLWSITAVVRNLGSTPNVVLKKSAHAELFKSNQIKNAKEQSLLLCMGSNISNLNHYCIVRSLQRNDTNLNLLLINVLQFGFSRTVML